VTSRLLPSRPTVNYSARRKPVLCAWCPCGLPVRRGTCSGSVAVLGEVVGRVHAPFRHAPKRDRQSRCASTCPGRDAQPAVLLDTQLVPMVGSVRFRPTRPMPPEHGMARVTADRAGRWHVSFCAPQPVIKRTPTGRAVGLDTDVVTTLTTSGGEYLHAPALSKAEAWRLRQSAPGSWRRRGRAGLSHALCWDRGIFLGGMVVAVTMTHRLSSAKARWGPRFDY